jgi:hypothetical protein
MKEPNITSFLVLLQAPYFSGVRADLAPSAPDCNPLPIVNEKERAFGYIWDVRSEIYESFVPSL